jgi:hypothetical protein
LSELTAQVQRVSHLQACPSPSTLKSRCIGWSLLLTTQMLEGAAAPNRLPRPRRPWIHARADRMPRIMCSTRGSCSDAGTTAARYCSSVVRGRSISTHGVGPTPTTPNLTHTHGTSSSGVHSELRDAICEVCAQLGHNASVSANRGTADGHQRYLRVLARGPLEDMFAKGPSGCLQTSLSSKHM